MYKSVKLSLFSLLFFQRKYEKQFFLKEKVLFINCSILFEFEESDIYQAIKHCILICHYNLKLLFNFDIMRFFLRSGQKGRYFSKYLD